MSELDDFREEVAAWLRENRPAEPIRFIADYLKTSSSACTGLFKSYKLIRLSPCAQQNFMDNVCAAYMNIDSKRSGTDSGLTGSEYMKLLNMLCLDFPPEVVEEVLAVFGKSDNEVLAFEDFVAGIQSVMLYEEFFQEAEDLFVHLDVDCTGRVPQQRLFDAIEKLYIYKVDITLPPRQVLKEIIDKFGEPAADDITFSDFAAALFKASI